MTDILAPTRPTQIDGIDDVAAGSLSNAVSRFVALFANAHREGPGANRTISAMHGLCAEIETAYENGLTQQKIVELIKPAYELHGRSPFISRLQKWPRGYPGDFETVEWLAEARPQVAPTDPAYWIEWYALNTAIAQQHRNKLAWQRDLIESVSIRGGRILNIGCGGCAELRNQLEIIQRIEFVLVDLDQAALHLAATRLKGAKSIRLLHGDIVRQLHRAARSGPYDLILCGGLFDYLPSLFIRRTLGKLVRALKVAEGTIAFTNISEFNPYRIWLEHLADWSLIHRSEEEVRSWFGDAGMAPGRLTIDRDGTGLTLLCAWR